jgi:spore germination protein GerM
MAHSVLGSTPVNQLETQVESDVIAQMVGFRVYDQYRIQSRQQWLRELHSDARWIQQTTIKITNNPLLS